jgi:hypothetical protein
MVRYVSPASTPQKLCFCHFFSGPEEVLEEVQAAWLTVSEVKNEFIWIVKPRISIETDQTAYTRNRENFRPPDH